MNNPIAIELQCLHCKSVGSYMPTEVDTVYVPNILTYHGFVKCKNCNSMFPIPSSGLEVFEKRALQIKIDHIYDMIEGGIF